MLAVCCTGCWPVFPAGPAAAILSYSCMSVCGVAGRRRRSAIATGRRSAVARVLVGIRNASLFATALMCHLVSPIKALAELAQRSSFVFV